MMIFLPFSQGASSSASGTRVVLPAPGGATSTAALFSVNVRDSSSRTASMGRGVSKVGGRGGGGGGVWRVGSKAWFFFCFPPPVGGGGVGRGEGGGGGGFSPRIE